MLSYPRWNIVRLAYFTFFCPILRFFLLYVFCPSLRFVCPILGFVSRFLPCFTFLSHFTLLSYLTFFLMFYVFGLFYIFCHVLLFCALLRFWYRTTGCRKKNQSHWFLSNIFKKFLAFRFVIYQNQWPYLMNQAESFQQFSVSSSITLPIHFFHLAIDILCICKNTVFFFVPF